MNHTASKLYDQASDTVHDWVDTVRDELPDIADVKNAAGDMTHRAGDILEDVADRAMALLPGAAAHAARTRRRRWMWGGVAVVGLALLFGPGGARRRAAIKSRLLGASAGETPVWPGTAATPSPEMDAPDAETV